MKSTMKARLQFLESLVMQESGQCPLYNQMLAAGWTMEDIDDLKRAFEKVEEVYADVLDSGEMTIAEHLDFAVEHALEFVESPKVRRYLKPESPLQSKIKAESPGKAV